MSSKNYKQRNNERNHSVKNQKNAAAQSQRSASSGVAQNGLDRFFHITERGSTVGREIRGGFVTFFSMAYILVINPIILSSALPENIST